MFSVPQIKGQKKEKKGLTDKLKTNFEVGMSWSGLGVEGDLGGGFVANDGLFLLDLRSEYK